MARPGNPSPGANDPFQGQEKPRSKRAKSQWPNNCQRPKAKNMTQVIPSPTVCVLYFFDVSYLIFHFCLAFGYWFF